MLGSPLYHGMFDKHDWIKDCFRIICESSLKLASKADYKLFSIASHLKKTSLFIVGWGGRKGVPRGCQESVMNFLAHCGVRIYTIVM